MKFVSLCESVDLTTASGSALAEMLACLRSSDAIFLRDRVNAGIDQAR